MTGEFPPTFATSRFGSIPVDGDKVITFPEGVLGFPDARHYILLETAENGVFFWLQSLDLATLAFVVIDPERLVKDYRKCFTLSDWDREFFAPVPLSELSAMAIVTFSDGPDEEVTANLQGPLLVREKDRVGRQVVIPEADSWLRTPVFGREKKNQDSL